MAKEESVVSLKCLNINVTGKIPKDLLFCYSCNQIDHATSGDDNDYDDDGAKVPVKCRQIVMHLGA